MHYSVVLVRMDAQFLISSDVEEMNLTFQKVIFMSPAGVGQNHAHHGPFIRYATRGSNRKTWDESTCW